MKRKRGGPKGAPGGSRGRNRNTSAPKASHQPSLEDDYSSSEEEEVNAYDMLLHSLGVEKERDTGALSSSSEEKEDALAVEAGRTGFPDASGSANESSSSSSHKNKGKKRRRRDSNRRNGTGSSSSSSGSGSSGSGSSSSSSSSSSGSGNSTQSESSVSTGEGVEGRGITDPFFVHFSRTISPEEVMTAHTSTLSGTSSKFSHPVLGAGIVLRPPVILSDDNAARARAHIKSRLRQHVVGTSGHDKGGKGSLGSVLSSQEMALLSELGTYKNIALTQRPIDSNEGYLRPYAIHVLNHVLKSRDRTLKNNKRVKNGLEPPPDQGFTRPKVLVLLPFRYQAYQFIQELIKLAPDTQGKMGKQFRDRLEEEFGAEDKGPILKRKPEDYKFTFRGNSDDCFRLGVSFTRNAVKLFTEFYASDVIIASPLGLRLLLPEKPPEPRSTSLTDQLATEDTDVQGGKKKKDKKKDTSKASKDKDCSFLSSIEVCIADRADIFLMQNFEHVRTIFQCLNSLPTAQHDTDYSRVRPWCLDGHAALYRQTVLISSYWGAEMQSLFSKFCRGLRGSVVYRSPVALGTMGQVTTAINQVFQRIDVASIDKLAEERFTYFIRKVMPSLRSGIKKQTMIFVPSYFDYVRVRKYFKEEDIEFSPLSEYTEDSDITRSRTEFYNRETQFIICTERFLFFRRYHIRGVEHVVLYGLPLNSHFYPELVHSVPSEQSVLALFTKFDRHTLERIVGSKRGKKLIQADRGTHLFC